MNIFYLGSVIAGRTLNLLCLLTLSYILTAVDFGIYTLVAINAQAVYLLMGAWIPNYAWKKMSSCGDQHRNTIASEIFVYTSVVIFIGAIICAASLVAMPVELRILILAIFVWSTLIMLFDIALVVLNAFQHPSAYAGLSLLRGILLVLLSAGLAAAGFGVWGAVIGSILATGLALVAHRGTWTVWRRIEMRRFTSAGFGKALRFGLASVLILNIYIIVNAVIRNMLGSALGPEEAGYVSLAADLFYAPIALFSTAISLSKIPQLYREAQAPDILPSDQSRDFLLANFAASVPYMVGGMLVASVLAELVLDADTARGVGSIAPLAVIQGGCFALISTQTTIGLTKGHLKYSLYTSIAAIGLVALGIGLASTYDSLYHYSLAATCALAIVATAMLGTSKTSLNVGIPVPELLKVAFATAIMAMVMLALGSTGNSFMTLSGIAVGGMTFIGVGLAMSSQSVRLLVRLSQR